MCITFLCTNGLSRRLPYKLILLNNRDEALDRATSLSHWKQGYLAGRDEQAAEHGTWLGMTRSGRIGNLLSITEPITAKERNLNAPSRGAIPAAFLTSPSSSALKFCDRLKDKASDYHGFTFLAIERNAKGLFDMAALTNRFVDEVKTYIYQPGAYVISNSPRDAPMRKVVHGQSLFEKLLDSLDEKTDEQELVKRLLAVGCDSTRHQHDPQIAKQTERDEDYNQHLSSIFVRFPPSTRYGTRCQTIVLIDDHDRVYWREERMLTAPDNPADAKWKTEEHRFNLES